MAIALPGRGQIAVQGPDARDFLQRLLTQDIGLLEYQPLIYAALLTAQGKFAFDMFIRKTVDAFGENYVLDCEGGDRALNLAKLLTSYKLRSEVALLPQTHAQVFAVFGAGQGAPDPRHSSLGYRLYDEPPAALPAGSFDDYDRLRISLALPDGSRDGLVSDSTLAELNIGNIAVSYTKGCFIGQEVTARLHNLGHSKRRLYTLQLAGAAPAPGAEIMSADGHYIGDMRSANGDLGLACLKDESIDRVPPTLGKVLTT